MISYPGDILARFGRYEAVTDLGSSGRAQLWRAWDPFLDRFVIVALLPDVRPAELYAGMRDLGPSLQRWTGGLFATPDAVLDFAPGEADAPYFVLRPRPAEAGREAHSRPVRGSGRP